MKAAPDPRTPKATELFEAGWRSMPDIKGLQGPDQVPVANALSHGGWFEVGFATHLSVQCVCAFQDWDCTDRVLESYRKSLRAVGFSPDDMDRVVGWLERMREPGPSQKKALARLHEFLIWRAGQADAVEHKEHAAINVQHATIGAFVAGHGATAIGSVAGTRPAEPPPSRARYSPKLAALVAGGCAIISAVAAGVFHIGRSAGFVASAPVPETHADVDAVPPVLDSAGAREKGLNRDPARAATTEHLCTPPNDVDECTKQCENGNVESCYNAGLILFEQTEGKLGETKAFALLEKACVGGIGAACDVRGDVERLRVQAPVVGEPPGHSKKAHDFLERGCKLSDVLACMHLGDGYQRGAFGRNDDPQAAMYFGKACDMRHEKACESLGLFLIRIGQHEAGLQVLGDSCERGTQHACVRLRNLYLSGALGVPQDLGRAAEIKLQLCATAPSWCE